MFKKYFDKRREKQKAKAYNKGFAWVMVEHFINSKSIDELEQMLFDPFDNFDNDQFDIGGNEAIRVIQKMYDLEFGKDRATYLINKFQKDVRTEKLRVIEFKKHIKHNRGVIDLMGEEMEQLKDKAVSIRKVEHNFSQHLLTMQINNVNLNGEIEKLNKQLNRLKHRI